jgi:hypothetical protein
MILLWQLTRIAYALAAGVFLLAAAVQWNDPDPWLWMVIYGVGGAFCLTAALGRLVATRWLALFMAALLAYAGWLGLAYWAGGAATPMYGQTLDADASWLAVEQPRELIGLMVMASVLATLWPWRRLRQAVQRRRGDASP